MGCCNVKISIKKEPVKLDIKTNIAVTGKQSYSTTVDLSMPDGDQVITPNEGRVFSEVTVKKPETMVPENIRKGTDIGGVVGTMLPQQPDMYQQLVDINKKLVGLSENQTITNYDFLENLDTSNVTSFERAFNNDVKLERVPESWNTSNVTSFLQCFYFSTRNSSFTKLPSWDYSKATNFQSFISNTTNIKNIIMNIPNATNLSYGFNSMINLENINLITSEKLTNMRGIFISSNIKGNINITNTEKVTVVASMFTNCSNPIILPNFNFKNVTVANNFIANGKGIKKIPNIFGNKVINFQNFAYGSTLEDCELDMLSCQNSTSMFYGCTNLTNLKLHNIKINIAIGYTTSYGTKLTKESLIFCIKELWSYKDTQAKSTLTMSTPSKTLIADIYVKLITPTQEQIEADPYINNKLPCEVCESKDEGAMTITAYANLKNWTIA